MSLLSPYVVETSCVRPMKKMTGSHHFKIQGYSLAIGKAKFLESTIFNVGGYNWSIEYYPNVSDSATDDYISIYLVLQSQAEDVKAQSSFTIVDQTGSALVKKKTKIINFSGLGYSWGYLSFAKKSDLESNIKDDCLIIQVVVTVFQLSPVEPVGRVVVPPGNLSQHLGHLLEDGNGVDVIFEVKGQTFNAHKCILAARSPVFSAQFFGPMKDKSDAKVKIKEMEAPVFKALLHFIYTDSFPESEAIEGSEEKHDNKLMAQHLLEAADRYGLERLKIICEKILCGSIDKNNVVSLLALAERHNCNHLKTSCLEFLVITNSFKEVLETEEFQQVIKNNPLVLKELL